MLPINLLPNYIFDKNKKRNAAIMWGVAAAAIAGLFIVWSGNIQNTINQEKAELDEANGLKTKYDAKVAAINKVKADIAAIKTKQDFIANAQTYNDAWPAAYDLVRNLTSPDVLLKSMNIDKDHKTVQLTGFAKNEMLIARWWIYLKNHKDIFDNVFFNLPPHPYEPPKPAGGAAGSGGFATSGGFPGSGGFGGSGGPSLRAPSAAGLAGLTGSPGSGGPGMPGSGGAGAAGGTAVGPSEIEGRPGINFTASAVLKTPIAPSVPAAPVWPSGPAPAAGGGAPGGLRLPGGPAPGSGGPDSGGAAPGGRGD